LVVGALCAWQAAAHSSRTNGSATIANASTIDTRIAQVIPRSLSSSGNSRALQAVD
jgi:hypothetical protein